MWRAGIRWWLGTKLWSLHFTLYLSGCTFSLSYPFLGSGLLIHRGRGKMEHEAWGWIFPSQSKTWGFWCEVLGFQQEEADEMKGVRIRFTMCGRTFSTAAWEGREDRDIWEYHITVEIFWIAVCVHLLGIQWKLS